MIGKTRLIDFAHLSLKDALDLAILVEEEAKDRYEEFMDQMEMHHNPDAAYFFRFMRRNEEKHQMQLSEKRASLYGEEPQNVRREMIFDIEAPEYDEVRSAMNVRDALDAALRAEEKAHTFFVEALELISDKDVKALFEELRDEEVEHQRLVKREIEKLGDRVAPGGDANAAVYEDEPVAHD